MAEQVVHLIDTEHLGSPRSTGCWLLGDGAIALVDPGPEPSVDNVLKGIESLGVSGDDLVAVLLTHIHLDHSGAAGRLAEMFPQLKFYVHQRGAPHLIDPERLLRSAERLYGDEMERLWGRILPVPEDRVIALNGGEEVTIGDRRLEVVHTLGHASHHVVYLDAGDGAAYAGDIAGMKAEQGFVIPPTPPPDIDIELWLESIGAIREWAPDCLRIAHYGEIGDVDGHLGRLEARLMHWSEVVEGLVKGESSDPVAAFTAAIKDDLRGEGSEEDVESYVDGSDFSPEQQWLGLERYWRKKLE